MDQKVLLKLARNSILSSFNPNIKLPEININEKRGVFVTLKKDNKLRGCIGFIEPIYFLKDAIVKAANAAAFFDPRFPKVKKEEIEKIKIELSILTKPELIQKDYPKNIKIGEDGLIVKTEFNSGVLLPQVALEYNLNPEKFLSQTCIKAGLNPNIWKTENINTLKVYKFQCQRLEE